VITEHTVCALPEDNVNYWHYAITVAYRGDGLWAVLNGGYCLGADGDWDYKPSPSGRDDDWLGGHRFDEAAALLLAEREAPKVTVNGFTVADALERGGR
jgi:hypothetical protein